MNKIYLFLVSVVLGSTLFTSCSDWNDDESLDINTPENPKYGAYLNDLRSYKKSDHKYIYAWFDNSDKTPSSRGQHMIDVPDSIDVVVLADAANLASFEVADMKQLQDNKGTKVVYPVDFDRIKRVYDQLVKDENEKNGTYIAPEFAAYLKDKVDSLLQISSQNNFDGLIVGYFGQSTVYMSESDKVAYQANQKIFLDEVQAWSTANPSKMISFLGNPQFLQDRSILSKCKHIILNTLDVNSVDKLGLYALQALAENVPSDRFVVFVNTVSLDTSDKSTGYYGATRALESAAYWITQGVDVYTKAGLAINNIQTDYYNPVKRYQYVRQSINVITPAPIN